MQCGIMIIINVSLSFQLRKIIPWHKNFQEGGKVFLAGGIGFVGTGKETKHRLLEELKEFHVADAQRGERCHPPHPRPQSKGEEPDTLTYASVEIFTKCWLQKQRGGGMWYDLGLA